MVPAPVLGVAGEGKGQFLHNSVQKSKQFVQFPAYPEPAPVGLCKVKSVIPGVSVALFSASTLRVAELPVLNRAYLASWKSCLGVV